MENNQYPYQKILTSTCCLELNINGNDEYLKVSYPLKTGIFSRLTTRNFVFEFNLNHEIRHAKSKSRKWIHPSEWLKRTMGNDWIYYSTGGYSGVFEALGEYYLPNLTYPTNSLLGGKPFLEPEINHMVTSWYDLLDRISATALTELSNRTDPADSFSLWMKTVKLQSPAKLTQKANMLMNILGERVSVMPPDARHVDYNFIPVHICDGCIYKCRFCKVKNKKKFSIRSQKKINGQINRLKQLYAKDIINYNAVFLGEHDALNAPEDLILQTAFKAYHAFNFKSSYMKDSTLFLFGSVDSFLDKGDPFFKSLDQLPYNTFINIGLESSDPSTLKYLGKPITAQQVVRAFKKIQHINKQFPRVEISCNFVMDETLPDAHYDALMALIRHSVNKTCPKGTIYLSPLAFGQPSRQVLYDFYKLKSQSRFPTFLYLIQRL